jgi:hypothetical protein
MRLVMPRRHSSEEATIHRHEASKFMISNLADAYVPVGNSERRPLGRGVRLTLLTAILFVGYTVVVKDIKTLSTVAPWGEDPYDAFFSLAIFFVAAVTVISAVRLALCRTSEPLPLARVIYLVRGCRVALVTMFATLAAGWTSVAAAGFALRSSTARYLVVGLAVETALAVLSALALRRAPSRLAINSGQGLPPSDWLDDLGDLATRYLAHDGLGAMLASRITRVTDPLATLIRRHPFTTASTLALGFGAFIALGAALEGDPPILLLLLGAIGMGAMLAFLVTIGSYLGLVRASTQSRSRRPFVYGLLAAAGSLPIAVAFRDYLWWIVGSNAADARLEALAELLAVVALASFSAVSLAEWLISVQRDKWRR